jgi:hypothetical protein
LDEEFACLAALQGGQAGAGVIGEAGRGVVRARRLGALGITPGTLR